MQVLLIYRHCFVTLSTEIRKWPPKTGRRKSPISENWPSFGRLDGRLAKSLNGFMFKSMNLILIFELIGKFNIQTVNSLLHP